MRLREYDIVGVLAAATLFGGAGARGDEGYQGLQEPSFVGSTSQPSLASQPVGLEISLQSTTPGQSFIDLTFVTATRPTDVIDEFSLNFNAGYQRGHVEGSAEGYGAGHQAGLEEGRIRTRKYMILGNTLGFLGAAVLLIGGFAVREVYRERQEAKVRGL